MLVSRVLARVSRSVGRSTLLLSQPQNYQFSILSHQFHSLHELPNKLVASQVSLLQHSIFSCSTCHRFGFSSSASPEPSEKDAAQSGNKDGSSVEKDGATKVNGEAKTKDSDSGESKESGSTPEHQSTTSQSAKRRRRETKRVAFSDSDSDSDSDSEDESDLSMDDLVKLVAEKEELLKTKHKEIEKMQDKVLRTYAEMENVMERTRREAENSKKFAIQSLAKALLDVADNLGRASSVVKDSFSKIDASKDTVGAVPLLKTLLEGVEMTEKQLADVFRKFGVEKFDPTNDQFDPNRHNAVFQIPDASKPPGTVAAVLKSGYTLYDRVIRPAEVGVVAQAAEDNAAENNVGDKGPEA